MPRRARNREWLTMLEAGITYRRIAAHTHYAIRTVKAGVALARKARDGDQKTIDPELARYIESQHRYRDDPAVRQWMLDRLG